MSVVQNSPVANVGRGMSIEDHAKHTDLHVGNRIRDRRLMHGLSQHQLASLIGVTYQQAHKYEKGHNRISAGRLFQIANVFGVSISWFFEGLEGSLPLVAASPRQRMALELVRNFVLIENEGHQDAICQMARVLASQAVARGPSADEALPERH